MEPPAFPTVFLRQLRYWSFHCSLNALPSLGIATFYLKLGKSPQAMAAMFAAIATFILLYAALTSIHGPLSDPGHLLSRALRLGAKIRGWISGISVLLLVTGPGMLLTPDLWCGFLSLAILNQASRLLGMSQDFFANAANDASANASFLPVFATTMLEGFILSFLLLMISFFALFFVRRKAQRRAVLGYPAFEE